MKPVVGTVAWLCGEVWFGLAAALDRALAYFPQRWEPPDRKPDDLDVAFIATEAGRYRTTFHADGTTTTVRIGDLNT